MVVNSSASSSKTAFRIEPDASVQLPNDSQKLQFGNDQDLNIWHGGSNGYIDNETGNLSIRTTSSNTVALHIASDVKIGINDNSPAGLFTVNNGTSDAQFVQMKNDNVGLFFGAYGTGHGSYPREATINGSRTDSGSSPFLRLAGQGGIKFCVDLNTERMRIESGGRVSILSDDGLFIRPTTSNPAGGAHIDFSDNASGSYSQEGTLRYKHSDQTVISAAQNDGVNTTDAFLLKST